MTFIKRYWMWFILAVILVGAGLLQTTLWVDTLEGDIYYLFLDGQRIGAGENPYSRVLASDMQENDKYTTIFPAFIELSYLTQQHRFRLYENWIALWRIPFLISNLAIGGLLFWLFYSMKLPVMAVLTTVFWLFNRWTLFIVKFSGIDFIPILLLLISLLLLPKRKWWAVGLFSLSLAFKQVGIFLLPLYLIDAYHRAGNGRWREVVLTGLGIASVPFITALPFLVWDFRGFIYSIMFSATRSQFQFPPPAESVDMVLQLSGIAARIPMLFLMLLVYIVALRNKIGLYLASLLTMAVFVDFNAIFFSQYMPWFILVLLLAVKESLENRFSARDSGLAPNT